MKLKTALQFSKIGMASFAIGRFNQSAGRRYLTEELGKIPGIPTKMGQILSMRFEDDPQIRNQTPDALPIDFVKKLILEDSPQLADQIDTIDPQAKTASIGQVHQAILKDGRNVAIKIRYPGIEKEIHSQLDFILTVLKKAPAPEKVRININEYDSFFNDFFHEELNYQKEARTQSIFWNAWQHDPRIIIPSPFPELSSDSILVQSFEPSQPHGVLTSLSNQQKEGFSRILRDFFLKGALDFGLIHTDLHRKNWGFRLETGQVVIYDFGATLNLSAPLRLALQQLAFETSDQPDRYLQQLSILGFNEDKLRVLKKELPILCEILFEPIRKGEQWNSTQWNLQSRINQLLGESKWNFRTAGPPWFLMLIRGLNGWLNTMNALAPDPLEVQTKMRVRVTENGKEKISLEFPSHTVNELEFIIPDEVTSRIRESGIDLTMIKQKALKSGCVAQELFELSSGNKQYRVWLE